MTHLALILRKFIPFLGVQVSGGEPSAAAIPAGTGFQCFRECGLENGTKLGGALLSTKTPPFRSLLNSALQACMVQICVSVESTLQVS